MALSNISILSIVELILYAPLIPFTAYLGYRHGKHAILGYLYLNIFCVLRFVADIVELANGTSPKTSPSLASIILSSVGLSPLLLALAGFLHEVHHYILVASTPSQNSIKKISRWLWIAQLQFHVICGVGMVLIIIGAVELATATTSNRTNSDDKLRSAGSVLLLILWFGLGQYGCWLKYRCRQEGRKVNPGVASLVHWILLATVFVGVKVVYVVVYSFDHTDSTINPVTGSFAVKVVFVFLVPLLAALDMSIGGWQSVDIASIPPSYAAGDLGGAPDEAYRLMVHPK